MKRIRHLLIKELTQIRRDRRLFGVLLAAPIVQLILLGFAANVDVREIQLAVRDNDHTVQSREFIRALGASGWFLVLALDAPVLMAFFSRPLGISPTLPQKTRGLPT